MTGEFSQIEGLAASNNYYSSLLSGQEDPASQNITNITWYYSDPGCGTQTGDPNNSGQLIRQ